MYKHHLLVFLVPKLNQIVGESKLGWFTIFFGFIIKLVFRFSFQKKMENHYYLFTVIGILTLMRYQTFFFSIKYALNQSCNTDPTVSISYQTCQIIKTILVTLHANHHGCHKRQHCRIAVKKGFCGLCPWEYFGFKQDENDNVPPTCKLFLKKVCAAGGNTCTSNLHFCTHLLLYIQPNYDFQRYYKFEIAFLQLIQY